MSMPDPGRAAGIFRRHPTQLSFAYAGISGPASLGSHGAKLGNSFITAYRSMCDRGSRAQNGAQAVSGSGKWPFGVGA